MILALQRIPGKPGIRERATFRSVCSAGGTFDSSLERAQLESRCSCGEISLLPCGFRGAGAAAQPLLRGCAVVENYSLPLAMSLIDVIMKKLIRYSCQYSAAALLSVFLLATAAAADSSSIFVPLLPAGPNTNASGKVNITLGSKSSVVTVQAKNLTPGGNYTFTVGGITELVKAADARGSWSATFRTSAKPGSPLLDFDPRGQVMTLSDGTANVLAAVVGRLGESKGSRQAERVQVSSPAGRLDLLAQLQASGRLSFSCALSKVTGTNWMLYVDGIFRGTIPVRNGSGKLMFDSAVTNNSIRLLDFDPRGQVVDIAQGTNLLFSVELEAVCNGVNRSSPSVKIAWLPSTGADSDGTAKARYRVDPDARRRFSLELEDVPTGVYDFSAASSNGLTQATITVKSTEDGKKGEIEFSSRPDDDELLLAFDPLISTFTISREAVVYFHGELNFGSATGSNEPPAKLEQNLVSTGLDTDASGRAEYEVRADGRRDFKVEVEDLPLGTYQLWVAGVQRGNLSVQSFNGQNKGEIEFRNPAESGKPLLNFDPRGQLLEIKSATGVFFSNLFTSAGGGDSNDVSLVEVRLELPLFNTGLAPAGTASMEFKRDDRGRRSFQVEIENAPTGSYTLKVGGVSRGDINVAASSGGTHGKLEFDDEPSSGETELNFDPLGKLIELSRDGQTWFGRSLPDVN